MLGALVLATQINFQPKLTIEYKLSRRKQDKYLKSIAGLKRDRMDIIAEILLFCNHERAKTKIMYNLNLNYTQLQNHLSYLTCKGLLQREERMYVTTEKGYRFLELFAEMQNILRGQNT